MAKFPHTASGGSFRMPFSKSTSSVAAKLCTNASCPNMEPAMIWSTNQLLCQLGPKKSWGHSQRLQWLTVSSGWSNASHAHTNSNEPWWTYQVEREHANWNQWNQSSAGTSGSGAGRKKDSWRKSMMQSGWEWVLWWPGPKSTFWNRLFQPLGLK